METQELVQKRHGQDFIAGVHSRSLRDPLIRPDQDAAVLTRVAHKEEEQARFLAGHGFEANLDNYHEWGVGVLLVLHTGRIEFCIWVHECKQRLETMENNTKIVCQIP